MASLISLVLEEVNRAKIAEPVNKEIYSNANGSKSNEFLFILKPEIFARLDLAQSQNLLDIVFDRLAQFDICVNNVRVINAAYLDTFEVMSQHYGVINAAARNFQSVISEEIKVTFQKVYNKHITEVLTLGALELKKVYPELSEETLTELWSKVDVKRLAGGVYAGLVSYEGKDLYLINGFHPPQLRHFIDENRVIVTMNLSGDIHWQDARNSFIGNTYPEKAIKGTLRRDLFDKFGKLGFDTVSYVINCVHLSAGPLEGLLEMERFNSEWQNKNESRLDVYSFGRMLLKEFSDEMIDLIISNPVVKDDEKEISLFDLTEEMNSLPALEIIKQSMR